MGAYRYLLKNETRRPKIDGVRETVWSMPFSHKAMDEGGGTRGDASYRSRRFANAKNTWEKYEVEFVALGGFEEGNAVYAEPATNSWVDEWHDSLGRVVGFLHKNGNGKWEVRTYGPWRLVTLLDAERGHRVARLDRSTIRGGYGKAVTESYDEFPDNADFWRALHEAAVEASTNPDEERIVLGEGGVYERFNEFSKKRSSELATATN